MEQSLSEKSYDYIREKLTSGDLSPGQRLVNRTLAEQIGVSVIPVREAIHRLASEGFVNHVPGAGAFVRKPDRQELDNMYVLRDALESCAAAEAARYITEEQLDELHEILGRALETLALIRKQKSGYSTKRQLDRWLDDEQLFHERLIEASRNPLLAKVVDEHRAISNVFEAQRNNPRLLTVEVAAETCDSKSALLQALSSRDADQARQTMSDQIQRGRRKVLKYLREQERSQRNT